MQKENPKNKIRVYSIRYLKEIHLFKQKKIKVSET